jgi:hypothetical protein
LSCIEVLPSPTAAAAPWWWLRRLLLLLPPARWRRLACTWRWRLACTRRWRLACSWLTPAHHLALLLRWPTTLLGALIPSAATATTTATTNRPSVPRTSLHPATTATATARRRRLRGTSRWSRLKLGKSCRVGLRSRSVRRVHSLLLLWRHGLLRRWGLRPARWWCLASSPKLRFDILFFTLDRHAGVAPIASSSRLFFLDAVSTVWLLVGLHLLHRRWPLDLLARRRSIEVLLEIGGQLFL